MDFAEVHELSDQGPIGGRDLEKMDILEHLEGATDGEVLGGFPQLVGNEDILGLETVPEKFLGQGIDEEGQGHDHSEKSVEAYKSLATVERAFRSLKTVDIEIRPI